MPRVRHTRISQPITDNIVAFVQKGSPVCKAGTICGVDPGILQGWMRQGKVDSASGKCSPHADFYDAVVEAEASLLRLAVETVSDLLDPTKSEPGVRLRAAIFLLTHRFPQHFSTRTEVTGPRGGPVELHARVEVQPLISNEALAAMGPAELEHAILAMARVAGIPEALAIPIGARPSK